MATKRKTTDVEVYSVSKKGGRTTTWAVRSEGKEVRRLTVSKSSAKTLDSAAKKYEGALKRLAKR